MPIKPENRALYPANWKKEIRPAALERAGHKCQHCDVPNYAVARWANGTWQIDSERIESFAMSKVEAAINNDVCEWEPGDPKWIVIVLTIAHLNHDPTDNRPENLRALCQRCHLKWDAMLHKTNSYNTRRKHKAHGDLFSGATK